MKVMMQVLKGIHSGIREVALKMLLEVEDPQSELESFTKVSIFGQSRLSAAHDKGPSAEFGPVCTI